MNNLSNRAQLLRLSFHGLFVICSLFFFLFTPHLVRSVQAAEYFFDSVAGLDTNSGTSADKPFKSISKMNSLRYVAGDVVNLKTDSDWSGTTLTITRSGSSGKPITFQSYGTGQKPKFSVGGGIDKHAIVINGNWIVIDGVLVTDTSDTALYVSGNNNIIRNSEVSRSGRGVFLEGRSNLVTRSYFHDLVMIVNTPRSVDNNDDYGAIAVMIDGNDNEVSYNKMENCKAKSFDYGTEGGTLEIWRTATRLSAHHNWSINNNDFIEARSDENTSVNNVVLAYNVMINDGSIVGIHFGGPNKITVTNLKVQNNTIVQTIPGIAHFSAWQGPGNSDAVIIKNNIFYSNSEFMRSNANYAHDHNLFFFTTGGSLGGTTLAKTEQIADPLFANLASNDFHLTANSPALKKGVSLNLKTDFEDKPVVNPPDLGAYQLSGSTLTVTPVQTQSPTFTPTIFPETSPSPEVTEVVSCTGDINQDGNVDVLDYSVFVVDFLKPVLSNPRTDLNGDGEVNLADYSLLSELLLQSCQ